ncbi:MAG: tyrosine-type recombinase/integrase [Streptosporangiaceae bacterium]
MAACASAGGLLLQGRWASVTLPPSRGDVSAVRGEAQADRHSCPFPRRCERSAGAVGESMLGGSRSRSNAVRGIEAVIASWTIGSEEDGCAHRFVCHVSRLDARPGTVRPGVRRAGLMRPALPRQSPALTPGRGAACGAALTCRRAQSGYGRLTSSGRPGKCSSGRRNHRPDGGSSAFPRRSFRCSASIWRSSPRDDPGALVFPGAKGGPLRRGNFNKMSAWPRAVESIGMTGLHFHDLRHTGNQFAAQSGARLRDLMARMGHDSERAAMIYQHEARGDHQRDRHPRTSRTGQARRRRGQPDRRAGPRWLMAR